MNEGIRLLRDSGWKGCVLVGDPVYYQRFGFRRIPELTLDGVPEENFMGLPFETTPVAGKVEFHPGFGAEG